MNNTRIISRKMLSGNDKYDYCPFCMAELEASNVDYKAVLRPLWKIVTATYRGKGMRDFLQERYECQRCKKADITVNDFVTAYCK